jgi:hypothetical protein
MTRNSVPAVLTAVLLLAATACLFALMPTRADAQQAAPLQCPSTMPGGTAEIECGCPATGGGGSVWGTDFYTDDSSLCHAAVHAGAIPATGGTIHARAMPGRDYYTGSRRNGITSADYGQWSRSVVYVGASSVVEGSVGVPLCPGTYAAGGTNWSGTCRCTDAADAPVWGSDTYTTDSNLCRAARHAGAIGAGGGLGQVSPAPGRASYAGSTRNGVTTSDWGSYGASFRVGAAKD